jgi:membrane protein implicated in regulation of membrane protease activity
MLKTNRITRWRRYFGKFAPLQKFFVVFFVLIAFAVCSVVVFDIPSTAFVLLLIDFIVANVVAIFASLRMREKEEEKLFN